MFLFHVTYSIKQKKAVKKLNDFLLLPQILMEL